MFWISDENNVANIPMMFLVVSRQSKTFLFFTPAWHARCTGSWEGTQLGQLTPTGQSHIPYHMASCPVVI